MSGKTAEKGYSVLLVMVILFSAMAFFSILMSFAIKSYTMEKIRGEKTRLNFLALSGMTVTLESLLSLKDKSYTDGHDITNVSQVFMIKGFRVRTIVEDENAKINIKDLKKQAQNVRLKKMEQQEEGKGFVTVYGNGKLNLNTASEEVLAIFFRNKNALRFFLNDRLDRPLKDLSEMEYLRQEQFRKDASLLNLPFTVKSNCFTIISTASSSKRNVTLKAVYVIEENGPRRVFFEKIQ